MAATIVGAFQPEMQKLITDSKILLVGAGGIGCEVLKVLVMMGFSDLEVVDLDTIEISNLNRQFLFSKESVGKPKSHVARESVLKFNPNVNIKSHFGNIMDQKYGTAFFNKFKLVINALDNRRARNHVNRMCLSSSIPLIESGTLGYSGQVEFIMKKKSLCYECLPKQEPKSYPMCTIRNTPTEPIHCITWAKFLFGQLFGEKSDLQEDVSMDVPVESDDNITSTAVSTREWAKSTDYDPIKLYQKIFFDDVDYLLSMPDLYKAKAIKPVPLDKSFLNVVRSEYSHEPDTKLLDLSQYITMFLDSVEKIRETLRNSKGSPLVWDKDDEVSMNFVVSSTNIRSHIFNIPFKSHFDIKSMAGNIIPAIATANAMIAGQIVIHSLRALRGEYERCQSVFLRGTPNHKGGILVKDRKLQKPNPNCMVCSSEGEIVLTADIFKFTVRQFEDLVLKNKLNMVAPDVLVDGRMIISSDEDDEVDLYRFLFRELNILDGSRLIVDDYFQTYSVKIMLYHRERKQNDPLFQIFNSVEELIKSEQDHKKDNIEETDDDCVMEKIKEEVEGDLLGGKDSVDTGINPNIVTSVNNEVLEPTVSNEIIDKKEVGGEDTGINPNIVTSVNSEVLEPTVSNEISYKKEVGGEELKNIEGEEMVVVNEEEKELVASDVQEFSTEEVLALKRKADADEDEGISESKKTRVSE